jgi:ABC-type bacteriocin/lantibiotic exporter with double-glycine peptidase domain
MNLKPPFFAQERYDTCALACLRMILAYYGTEVSEAELVRMTAMEEGGVDIEELARVARRCGLPAEILSLSEKELMELNTKRRWVIVYLNRWPLDRVFAIHAVIPIRFSRVFLTVLDPMRGQRRLSRRKFDQARQYLDRLCVVCDHVQSHASQEDS